MHAGELVSKVSRVRHISEGMVSTAEPGKWYKGPASHLQIFNFYGPLSANLPTFYPLLQRDGKHNTLKIGLLWHRVEAILRTVHMID